MDQRSNMKDSCDPQSLRKMVVKIAKHFDSFYSLSIFSSLPGHEFSSAIEGLSTTAVQQLSVFISETYSAQRGGVTPPFVLNIGKTAAIVSTQVINNNAIIKNLMLNQGAANALYGVLQSRGTLNATFAK